ncbi:uncharacterized protein LOC124918955 isoform X1 [Impatiens glandulifera]|uniref:uncharacterized protein LOC124918955 isoform X1 n=1 Tax=Impatiens glandulifera TaxID=253017 RepID=UPI001FB14BE0|nr:uncharacterized protein LOC124918955 isoform X1 [Impatiens glandulifera]
MQALLRARLLVSSLRPPRVLFSSDHGAQASLSRAPYTVFQSPNRNNDNLLGFQKMMPVGSIMFVQKEFYCSGIPDSHTEAVKELYDKMLESLSQQRSMPPNAWLWSLIDNCTNVDDIKLLFNILKRLKIFRLSNLRIHGKFDCNLCGEVTKASIRAGAIDFGKKALWKHNVYGLSPSLVSAHHLLMYAKQQKDVSLMVDTMKLIEKNNLPLQPSTADIIFSICYNADDWELMNKYSKIFVKAGVKLRRTSFDLWMDFAAKRGDVDSLMKIEILRSETTTRHSILTAISCAKLLLLQNKPEDAAAMIRSVNQILPKSMSSKMIAEFQKLVEKWPLEVIKHQKDEDIKESAAAALQKNINVMLVLLADMV